ncbi:glutaredoxin family protein [Curtobacterium sp. MCBD17_026]|uniref:glutaredoxin family protein n=1 Tax=Curtobacterium sp. MCBD17_026 TaxID=2175621 RepID=UPI000DA9CBAF|nr:glutaredoxin family protein [Curtobacterium sp. MCBD17_026]WIB72575.1 glutaredoxin family protein [Curtobacterium sp. MCBD17_026]
MTSVTIYTKPDCFKCDRTKKFLSQKGVPYREVDVTTNDAALDYVTQELGYSEAPIVVVDDEPENHWSGLRPDLILALHT